MHDFIDFAVAMAKDAGHLLKGRFFETHTIDYKGEIDIVTEADRMSEDLIVSRINQNYSDHDILTEETPWTTKYSNYRWIIDPLDGTTNYAHGFPFFCISLALEIRGDVKLGVIYNPMLDEMFHAEKGKGAFLNGRPIHVSAEHDLSKSLLATGFPYDIRDNTENNLNYFNAMLFCARAIRRAGAAALDMAYVAAGRFDGFWELRLQPWDTAAAWLMVKEAGGIVTDLGGGTYYLESPHIIASNGKIHRAMFDVFNRAGKMSH